MRQLRLAALCVGTNGLGALRLRYAEKDAVDVANFHRGQSGIYAPESVTCLIAPTVHEAREALRQYVGAGLDVFTLFNSGHGNRLGVRLADGMLGYHELSAWIAMIGAKHSLVELDVCSAASYIEKRGALGDVVVGAMPDRTVLEALARATPGNRVYCSTGADRSASEGAGVENGHYTAARLEAASVIDGSHGLVMNDSCFRALKRICVQRWDQVPQALGNEANDLPVARDQRRLDGGAAAISSDVTACGLVASAVVTGRYGVPTRWRAELSNRNRRVLATIDLPFVPDEDVYVSTATFVAPVDALVLDPTSRTHLMMRRAAPVLWRISVEDLRGRAFERFQVPAFWSRQAA
jgi:hypothetical protein